MRLNVLRSAFYVQPKDSEECVNELISDTHVLIL